jgi:hypothetical protein
VREFGLEHEATLWFCSAITFAPETVDAAKRRLPLTADAEIPFEKAKRYCSTVGGFRTRIPRTLTGPNETWWTLRTLLTPGELFQRVEECFRDGNDFCVDSLWNEAPGLERFERKGNQWCGRDTELNRIYVRSLIRSGSTEADRDGRWPDLGFALALRLSPALVDAALKEHVLSAKARAAFEQAKASDEYTGCVALSPSPPAPDLFDTPVDANASSNTGTGKLP